MSQKGIDKYFDGSIVVTDSVTTRRVVADDINGTPAKEYLTKKDIDNPETVKEFEERDGGLLWKGVALVPPNDTQVDRPYTEKEISDLVASLWEGADQEETNSSESN